MTFISLECDLQETGGMGPNMINAGISRSCRMANVEDDDQHATELSLGASINWLPHCHHISQWRVVMISATVSVPRNSLFMLCNCHSIMGTEKCFANGHNSGMQLLQPSSTKCCWRMKYASHRIRFWKLITSTHGLMKIHNPFKKHNYNCFKRLTGNLLLGSYKLPSQVSKLFTASIWKTTATTGSCSICNMVDNVGTAWRSSCPFFLWHISSHYITR